MTPACARLLSGGFSSGWGGVEASKGCREAMAISGAFGAFLVPLWQRRRRKSCC